LTAEEADEGATILADVLADVDAEVRDAEVTS
jgi:hypothetical protein